MAVRHRAIGFDIGGTKVAAGLVDYDGQILERVSVPTPNGDRGQGLLKSIVSITEALTSSAHEIGGIGIGIAGMVEWPSGYVRWAPNSPYRSLQLRDLIHSETGLKTVVDNDANVAALGEAHYGAGRNHRHVLVLTVGTGVGGGIVVDGRVFRGSTGLAGEIGHLKIGGNDLDGLTCGCGLTGCLETMASGTTLGRRAEEEARRDPAGALAKIGSEMGYFDGGTVERAARAGDATALRIYDEVGYWLGIATGTLVSLLDPDVVAYSGGAMATAHDLMLPKVDDTARRIAFGASRRSFPRIVTSELALDVGIVGAACLILHPE